MQVARFLNARRGAQLAFLGILLAGVSLSAFADPVSVGYTVTGSSGAWILDFSVTNNLNAGQGIYFFGVLLPTVDVVGTPSPWLDCKGSCGAVYNPSSMGGPNINYNNLWIDIADNGILFGQTLSGFKAEVTSATPPATVDWLLFSFDFTPDSTSPYNGGGNFFSNDIPGFAGTAVGVPASPVPEPSSLLLFSAGLLGLARRLFRRA